MPNNIKKKIDSRSQKQEEEQQNENVTDKTRIDQHL